MLVDVHWVVSFSPRNEPHNDYFVLDILHKLHNPNTGSSASMEEMELFTGLLLLFLLVLKNQ